VLGGMMPAQPVPQSNVERLAGWGLWYVYWRIFRFGFMLAVCIGLIALGVWAGQHPELL
jgi:hypothetical protein